MPRTRGLKEVPAKSPPKMISAKLSKSFIFPLLLFLLLYLSEKLCPGGGIVGSTIEGLSVFGICLAIMLRSSLLLLFGLILLPPPPLPPLTLSLSYSSNYSIFILQISFSCLNLIICSSIVNFLEVEDLDFFLHFRLPANLIYF